MRNRNESRNRFYKGLINQIFHIPPSDNATMFPIFTPELENPIKRLFSSGGAQFMYIELIAGQTAPCNFFSKVKLFF